MERARVQSQAGISNLPIADHSGAVTTPLLLRLSISSALYPISAGDYALYVHSIAIRSTSAI
jgi:hypothetical protein